MFNEYREWLFYITDLFLPMCDSENGNFQHLPEPGGMLDQPYLTMQILKVIQGCYQEHLHERIQKMQKKNASSGGRRMRRPRR